MSDDSHGAPAASMSADPNARIHVSNCVVVHSGNTLPQALRDRIGSAIEDLPRTIDWLVAATRSAALEEAAKVADNRAEIPEACDEILWSAISEARSIAAAIRELKDK